MKLLEERILKDGHILGDNILKVDSFLTHQVDFSLMREIGKVFAEKFAATGITKVVTIEASGIAPAVFTAEALNVPMIFAKKAKNITMNEGILTAQVYSFTKQVTSTVSIAAGVGLNNSNLFVSMPTAFQMFFSNGIVVASLLAIVLNAVLNHKKK